jgi:apolipoprotein N-acyltransferase
MKYSKNRHYSLLASSALLYAIPYLVPGYCWWASLFFLVPLFRLVLGDSLTLKDGLWWSILAFNLHLCGVLEGLFLTGQGSCLVRLVPVLLLLLGVIGYGTLWFTISLWLCRITTVSFVKLTIWVLTTWLFFLFLERGSLFFLGRWEGYLLTNPLVPLVQFPALLYFLPKVGSGIVLLFFVITQALFSSALYWGKWWWFFVGLCMSVWLGGIVMWYHEPTNRFDSSTIVCGSAYFISHDNITYGGRIIRDYCKMLLTQFPETDIIIFPETAIRCPILPGESQIVELFNAEQLGKPVTILTGGFRWDNNIYRNTVYWIHDGKVVDIFDKRHAMALTERAPSEYFLGKTSIIKDNYFKTFVGIVPNKHKRPVWKITESLEIVPYICSELFFNNMPDHAHDSTSNCVIIALCNDDWVKRDFMQYQMVMGARYRAIQWQIPIIYVAHFYQVYCGPHGEYQPLKAFDHNSVVSS